MVMVLSRFLEVRDLLSRYLPVCCLLHAHASDALYFVLYVFRTPILRGTQTAEFFSPAACGG